jgi:tetratricopeptide (TPR) repeat protein
MVGILTKLNLANAARYSADDLARVAKEGNAQFVLTGSVMRAGQRTVVTTRLLNAATGEVVKSDKFDCAKEEEILAKVDDLARTIKVDLDLSERETGEEVYKSAAQMLTSSPEALKYYMEARRLHSGGAWRDAIPLFQQAVDADPGFALAYRGLGVAYANVGDRARRDAAIKRAIELSDRLPERFRYQTQLYAYVLTTPDYRQAVEVGNKLLAKYPDDGTGLNYMGSLYCGFEEFTRCIQLREAGASAMPTYVGLGGLASAYAATGQYDKARRVLDSLVERNPNNAMAHFAIGTGHLVTGDFAAAEREAEKVMLLEPRNVSAALLTGDLAHLRGDFAASERDYQSILEQGADSDRRTARVRLSRLYVTQGRFEKAREQLQAVKSAGTTLGWLEFQAGHPERAVKAFQIQLADPASASDRASVLAAVVGLGVLSAVTGDMAGAEKALENLKRISQGFDSSNLIVRCSLLVSGAMAARRGDARAAVADLERAVSLMPHQAGVGDDHAAWLTPLAQAYLASGDLAKATATYEQVGALTTGRLSSGALFARSYYQLGLIAERQGDQSRAREQLRKFLEIWKDADPGLPEVADAKKRLAR